MFFNSFSVYVIVQANLQNPIGTNLIPNYFQLFQTFFITHKNSTNTAYLYTKSIEGSRTKKHVHTILD